MKHVEISRFPELDNGCSEALNSLCASISGFNEKRTILITSRYSAEGKTFVAMNLMRSLARMRKKVVLLDADLRYSTIVGRYHMVFENGIRTGLSQFLLGECGLDDIICETNISNGYIVPAGKQIANPLIYTGSDRMHELLNQLKAEFDIVIVDSTSIDMYAAEAVEIAKCCDYSLLVVSHRCGKQKDIITVKSKLERVGCEVMGIVMNNVEFDSFSSRRYFSAERKALKALTRRDLK